jgi:hypothetical protein
VNRITTLETASAGWVTTADGNTLWANKSVVDAMGNTVLSHESRITQQADSISLIVTEVSGLKQDMVTAQSKITQLADSIELIVSEVDDLTGNEIVSRINQTADAVTIEASKINLTGAITANGNVFINPDGTLVAKDGKFNGYLSFPFKNMEDSDATLTNQGTADVWKLNQDVNLVASAAAQSTCTILLPSDIAFNGVLVNIFRSNRRMTYSDGTVEVKTEDGSALCINYATNGLDSVTRVNRVEVSGALLQFLCVVAGSTPYWILLGKQG